MFSMAKKGSLRKIILVLNLRTSFKKISPSDKRKIYILLLEYHFYSEFLGDTVGVEKLPFFSFRFLSVQVTITDFIIFSLLHSSFSFINELENIKLNFNTNFNIRFEKRIEDLREMLGRAAQTC